MADRVAPNLNWCHTVPLHLRTLFIANVSFFALEYFVGCVADRLPLGNLTFKLIRSEGGMSLDHALSFRSVLLVRIVVVVIHFDFLIIKKYLDYLMQEKGSLKNLIR